MRRTFTCVSRKIEMAAENSKFIFDLAIIYRLEIKKARPYRFVYQSEAALEERF